jgi:hypothetical protein
MNNPTSNSSSRISNSSSSSSSLSSSSFWIFSISYDLKNKKKLGTSSVFVTTLTSFFSAFIFKIYT